METFYPTWFEQEKRQSREWTREENKKFESALAKYDENTPDRWQKVAALIPGKTVSDVMRQYRELEEDVSEIEAGRVPIPVYLSSFTLELTGNRNFDAYRKKTAAAAAARNADHERKKGVPWTEEEHRRFLMGLLKYGKGDWRNISRNFVVSKTPTQVASHAQKYFIRQLSGGKDKRRPSIHDITTFNLVDTTATSDYDKPTSLDHSSMLSSQKIPSCTQKVLEDLNQYNDGRRLMVSPFEDIRLGKTLYDTALYEAYAKPHKSVFQVQTPRHQIFG